MATAYTLPAGVKLEYLAEGAANIVYRITWPPSNSDNGTRTPPTEADLYNVPQAISSTTPPPTEIDPIDINHQPDTPAIPAALRDRLLRLRKAVPWIPSYSALHDTQAKLINPYFPPSDLVPQDLVLLPQGLAQTANAALHAAEAASTRPEKRHGLYLAEDEPHGLLVRDMSPSPGQSLVEVKPKWLSQSPNAPEDSTRCRTCALRAMRRGTAKGKASQTAAAEDDAKDFCPLALASGDPMAVDDAVRAVLVAAMGPPASEAEEFQRSPLQQALVMYFLTTPVLSRIRALQEQLDPSGVLALPESSDETGVPGDDFLVATTLRDCTLFVRVSAGAGGALAVEGRLGDLDLKAPEPGKVKYWRGLERELVEGGWYVGYGSDGKCWLENDGGGFAF